MDKSTDSYKKTVLEKFQENVQKSLDTSQPSTVVSLTGTSVQYTNEVLASEFANGAALGGKTILSNARYNTLFAGAGITTDLIEQIRTDLGRAV